MDGVVNGLHRYSILASELWHILRAVGVGISNVANSMLSQLVVALRAVARQVEMVLASGSPAQVLGADTGVMSTAAGVEALLPWRTGAVEELGDKAGDIEDLPFEPDLGIPFVARLCVGLQALAVRGRAGEEPRGELGLGEPTRSRYYIHSTGVYSA